MKCIFRCATVIIAVLLASLFSESRVLPWSNSCLHAHTVRADTHGMNAVPPLVLWAWERPEDLRFIKPGAAGIAFLARTVWVDGNNVSGRPRLQPLRFNSGTRLMAVVRIESAGRGLPAGEPVARQIQEAAALPGVRALQIDFDARERTSVVCGTAERSPQSAAFGLAAHDHGAGILVRTGWVDPRSSGGGCFADVVSHGTG